MLPNVTVGLFTMHGPPLNASNDALIKFRSLQYALFTTIFIEILGSLLFFLTALYIENDKARVDLAIAGETNLFFIFHIG